MEEIIIDIPESGDAAAFKSGNIIHVREFERAKTLIDQRVDSTTKDFHKHKTAPIVARNETITIVGKRGTGKTSFIKSVLSYYELNAEQKGDIQVIELIDPTMLEEKGHIFLTVISIINDKVRTQLEQEGFPESKIKDWDKTLNKLAAGLPSIDGVGGDALTGIDWQDPQYIMQNGLVAVKSAFELSVNFNSFLFKALTLLDKRIFIIAFDDIDVDFLKGWPILEMIRKYFTNNLVVTIVSGDLRLFSTAIRKNKWSHFGKALLINEGELLNKTKEYNDRVTEMEHQYLLKVLKPTHRLLLQSLKNRIANRTTGNFEQNIDFKIKFSSEGTSILLIDEYYRIFREFGVYNKYQFESFRNYMLSLPIRTQIQFLSIFSKEITTESKLLTPFLSDLFEKDVNTDQVENSPELINVAILKLLLQERDISGSYQLMPVSADESMNSSVLALNMYAAKRFKDQPYLIFDYIIRIGFIRNALTTFPYKKEGPLAPLTYEEPTIDDLCHHAGLFQDKVLRDSVGHMNAYIDGFSNSDRNEFGMMRIGALSGKTKKSREENKYRLDVLLSDATESRTQEIIGYLPFSIHESSKANLSNGIYSIYMLFAALGELIRKSNTDGLMKGFVELSQVRTYIMPSTKLGIAQPSGPPILNESERTKADSDLKELEMQVISWISKYAAVDQIAVHTLGKISTRFFYALNTIEQQERNKSLGDRVHRRVIAFLNSVLYENALENLTHFENFNNNNPISDDRIFLSNLKASVRSNEHSKMSFSKWLLSCPLLLCYLNPESSIWEHLFQFTEANNLDFITKSSIYKILQREKSGRELEPDIKIRYSNSDIVNALRSNKISMKIFRSPKNRADSIELNKEIRDIISRVLNQEWSATRIYLFRKYLAVNKLI